MPFGISVGVLTVLFVWLMLVLIWQRRLLPGVVMLGSFILLVLFIAGIIGTAIMLAECSGVGAIIDVLRIPRPDGVSLERWLQTFPSFGYLLAVAPPNVPDVLARFAARGIAATQIGAITEGDRVEITDGRVNEVVWDFSQRPLIGCRTMEAIA